MALWPLIYFKPLLLVLALPIWMFQHFVFGHLPVANIIFIFEYGGDSMLNCAVRDFYLLVFS